jgi:hypothetical protein
MRFESLWDTFEALLHNMRVDKSGIHEPTAGIE